MVIWNYQCEHGRANIVPSSYKSRRRATQWSGIAAMVWLMGSRNPEQTPGEHIRPHCL